MFIPSWIYNEFLASGVDYTDKEVVTQFERRHQNFRDFEKEFELIKQRVSLKSTDEVLDVGCGTGAFILPASRNCKHIYGVDISSGMLGILQKKLDSSKITNVTLCNAGFLTFRNHNFYCYIDITSYTYNETVFFDDAYKSKGKGNTVRK